MAAAPSTTPPAPDLPIHIGDGAPVRSLKERTIKFVCFLAAAVSVLTTAGIVVVLFSEAWVFFTRPGVSAGGFFTGTKWAPTYDPPHFGILPLLAGTLQITVGSAIVAVPLGILSAIFLSEYAHPRVRTILKPALEILAGIPTVVYGYFALFHITPMLRQFIPDVDVFNAASGAIVVGIMILPLVSSLCEDALTAVPRALREGAYGLGSTKAEVTTKIVFPAALSGIMAAFILAISRAVGETMAVTLAAGQTPNLTMDPRESIQTMTAYIVQMIGGDTPAGTTAYYTIFAVGAMLFVITMLLNIAAVRLIKRYRMVYQ